MPTDSSSPGPRRHFHRGRRGHDRRGSDRRAPQPQGPQTDQGSRGEHVDVEQIMREIRARIAQRHGLELTDEQVQDLAARRLESILDPRNVKPSLLDQLRRSSGIRPDTAAAADRAAAPYSFEDTTLYESPSAIVRFFRRLLRPVLKLFFNPNPLIHALHTQARVNQEALRREAERDRQQAEWNALHYDILTRMVAEVSRVSLEVQNLLLRVESLSTKVDFNDRRVRGVEGAMHQLRPGGGRDRDRDRERVRESPALPPPAVPGPVEAAVPAAEAARTEGPSGEAPRRRRRRRRGRRTGAGEGPLAAPSPEGTLDMSAEEEGPVDEGELEAGNEAEVAFEEPAAPVEAAPAPERVTPQLEEPAPDAREAAAPELPPAPSPEPDEPR